VSFFFFGSLSARRRRRRRRRRKRIYLYSDTIEGPRAQNSEMSEMTVV
jgi:hypothetical protein